MVELAACFSRQFEGPMDLRGFWLKHQWSETAFIMLLCCKERCDRAQQQVTHDMTAGFQTKKTSFISGGGKPVVV